MNKEQIDEIALRVARYFCLELSPGSVGDFTHAMLAELAKVSDSVEFHLCEGCGHYYQTAVTSCDCMAELPLKLVVMHPLPQPDLVAEAERKEWALLMNADIEQLRQQLSAAQNEIDKLRKGEFICQKCGLRKGGDHDSTPEF